MSRMAGYGLLTKFQYKQWKKLTSRFRITQREFLDYYTDVRKANAKIKRLDKAGEILDANKFSTKVDRIMTRSDFNFRVRRNKKVLNRRFRSSHTTSQRQQLYANIDMYFGEDGQAIKTSFDKMSDDEFIDFFKVNSDLQDFAWGSPKTASQLADMIQLSVEKVESRLQSFNATHHE